MIQVTLNANEFNHAGKHNDREYTSLQVKRTSNGRVYFTTIKNGIRLSEMAKQMQLVDGNVIVSFGKNDKLIIGSYVDTEATGEEVQEEMNTNTPAEVWSALLEGKKVLMSREDLSNFDKYAEETFDSFINIIDKNIYNNQLFLGFLDNTTEDGKHCFLRIKDYDNNIKLYNSDKERALRIQNELLDSEQSKEVNTQQETPANTEEKTLVDTFTTNEYKIELLSSLDKHNHKAVYLGETVYKYHLTFTDINTGSINHELSDVVYLSLEATLKEIKLYVDVTTDKQTITEPAQDNLPITPTETISDSIPQTNMIADYANIVFDGNKVNVVFTNSKDKTTATFKYRRSWSNRKYIDQVFKQSKIVPSWEFKYGWEHIN